ncbi:MAG: hypothetical protein KBT04_01805 [Bacteroidales bacterium]|nr:hypothetical protein [Candidatus Colimorpha onthohippi]
MTREEQRHAVITAAIVQQQQVADIAQKEMDSAQQQCNEYGANVDRYDAYRTKLMRQRDMYAKQLSNALAALRVLDELDKQPPHQFATHGAIVIASRGRFFLSIGAGKFVADGIPYFAISAQTPAYMAIKDKSVGDTFTINGMAQTIIDIL